MEQMLQAFSIADCMRIFVSGVVIGFVVSAILSILGGFVRGVFNVVIGNQDESR